jgi:hypothetical protein
MFHFGKCFAVLGASLLLGCSTFSSDSERQLADSRDKMKQAVSSYEKALPALVASGDYWSASNIAFLLATARKQLDQSASACEALDQSLDFYRKALIKDTGITEYGAPSHVNDDSDGMADVRAKFGCVRRVGSPA